MILGIMQPYFFPHLGYFDLINYSDRWIVFDTVKYIRHGWVNRNRIHHPTEGWQYLVVPLEKHSNNAAICDIKINKGINWKSKIAGQLQHYKKRAPYFKDVSALVSDCIENSEESLSRLNVSILEKVSGYLGIEFKFDYFSEMDLKLGVIDGPGDWALNISLAVGATTYVNPPGGEALFDRSLFQERGIGLEIREIPPLNYTSTGYEFIPRLSIIDLLMWNSPTEIKHYLDLHKHQQTMGHGDNHKNAN